MYDQVTAYRNRPLPEPRRRVYQPELPAALIHELWQMKQQTGRPMTALLAEAVTAYLAAQHQEPTKNER